MDEFGRGPAPGDLVETGDARLQVVRTERAGGLTRYRCSFSRLQTTLRIHNLTSDRSTPSPGDLPGIARCWLLEGLFSTQPLPAKTLPDEYRIFPRSTDIFPGGQVTVMLKDRGYTELDIGNILGDIYLRVFEHVWR